VRPWIEFVQMQRLPVDRGHPGITATAVDFRVLSADDEDGSASLLLHLANGEDFPDFEPERDVELFVTAGSLEVVGEEDVLGPFSYRFMPAGGERPKMRATRSSTVLVFTGPLRDEEACAMAGERTVEPVEVVAKPWQATVTPGLTPGAARKDLRNDPLTGEQTWVLGTLPMRFGSRSEWHPVVEEMVLLSGVLNSPLGDMHPGAYFWRPPGEEHGPFGSRSGTVMLFRTVGGPLETTFAETEEAFGWTARSEPIVPHDLRVSMDMTWQAAEDPWVSLAAVSSGAAAGHTTYEGADG